MICDGCGHGLPDNAKFCPECGRPVTQPSVDGAPVDRVYAEGAGDAADAPRAAAAPAADAPRETDAAPAADAAEDAAPSGTVPGGATGDAVPASGSSGADDVPPTAPIPKAEPAPVPDDLAATRERVRPRDLDAAFGGPARDPFDPAATGAFPGDTEPAFPVPPEPGDAKGRTSRLGLVSAVVVFLAALALLVAFVTWRMELWGGRTLPDTVGMDQAQATQLLQDGGFSVATSDVVSDGNVGKVVEQEPAPGRRVDPGTVVALGVGVERSVPDVEGMTLDDAKRALEKRGIARLRIEYENSDREEGTVISASPAAGTVVAEDDVVTLVVAQPYTVPEVAGLSSEEAREAVTRAGLTPKEVLVASDEESGTVVSTDPGAGATLKQGATVTLNVSSPYPSTPYAVTEYLSCRPQDLSTYLRDRGYSMRYGASKDNVATMTWTGPAADPEVVIGPNPFARYEGFQFWATDALAAGASVDGVRLQIVQENAPADAGTLKVDQSCVNALMNACGLKASSGTTTVATPQTVTPKMDNAPDFVAKAGTSGDTVWAVVVWRQGDAVQAAVCAAHTETLEDNLKKESVDLGHYGDSMANLAASYIVGEAGR